MKKKKTNQKTLGHQLKIARKRQKMSVEELARKINMCPRYIKDIENGEITQVDASILHRIAIALGTTIADLCGLPIKTQGGWRNP